VGWFCRGIWQQLSHALSLGLFLCYSNTQLLHAISGLYNSFPISIRGLRILIYTIPFLFQYTVFEYLYILQIFYQQNYRVISLLLYRLKKIFMLYRMFQICFSIIFSRHFFLDGFVSLMWCFYVFLSLYFPLLIFRVFFIWFFFLFPPLHMMVSDSVWDMVFFCFFSRWFPIFVW